MSDTVDLETLADRADELARKFSEPPTFVVVRAALNEAGVVRARALVVDALAMFEHAQAVKRDADIAERAAKDALDGALVAAEWELDGRFTTSGNKTLLDGEKAMTADERSRWKATEARKLPEVARCAEVLRNAEHATAEARDALTASDKRLSATRADLDAAVATLNALALALPIRERRN